MKPKHIHSMQDLDEAINQSKFRLRMIQQYIDAEISYTNEMIGQYANHMQGSIFPAQTMQVAMEGGTQSFFKSILNEAGSRIKSFLFEMAIALFVQQLKSKTQ